MALSNIFSTFYTSAILENGQWEHFVSYNVKYKCYLFIPSTVLIKQGWHTLRTEGELEIIFQGPYLLGGKVSYTCKQ